MMNAFQDGLTAEDQANPRLQAYRVSFVPKTGNRASSADLAVEFVKPDYDDALEINRVLLKEARQAQVYLDRGYRIVTTQV